MSAKDIMQEIIQSPKVAAAIAVTSTGSGVGTMFNWIPDDIGKLTALVGFILSIVLIRVHLLSLKRAAFELEVMRLKEKDRAERAKKRLDLGKPIRRRDDFSV